MKKIFDPILEYRIYIQTPRTKEAIAKKLDTLAKRGRTTPKSILRGYAEGVDILDPELFDREDLIGFAEGFGLMNDLQMKRAISKAQPRKYHQLS